MKKINKILIANRGEIAVRILQTLKKMEIRSAIIYTIEDENSLARALADESYLLSCETIKDTYLNIEAIIKISLLANVDAVHPGYGFLSESADFAMACENAGLIFIGPSADAIRLMGDKINARNFAEQLGIPVLKSLAGNIDLFGEGKLTELKFPVIIKPSGGGGGKGMRIVRDPLNLEEEILATSRESGNYFAKSEVYLEEYIENARHIEVQVFGDGKGNGIHLFERECSIQRRFQKIVEEAPSPALNDADRVKLFSYALAIVKASNYKNAGTVEFLMDENKNFYFLEMNARIQVEHPVTESITGIDIVEAQIRIAENNSLPFEQQDIRIKGHAIELRVYAEDPYNDFLPSPGAILSYHEPEIPGLRIDKGFIGKTVISAGFDPLIAKLTALRNTRQDCLDILSRALLNYSILGIATNQAYLASILSHPAFVSGNYNTSFCKLETSKLKEEYKSRVDRIPVEIIASSWALAFEKGNKQIPGSNPWSSNNRWRSFPQISFYFKGEYITYLVERHTDTLELLNWEGKSQVSVNAYSSLNLLEFNNKLYYCDWYIDTKGDLLLQVNTMNLQISRFPDTIRESVRSGKGRLNGNEEMVLSPMHGKIISVKTEIHKQVKKGEVLMVLESMKMENNICASRDGYIHNYFVKAGQQVEKDAPLLVLRTDAILESQVVGRD